MFPNALVRERSRKVVDELGPVPVECTAVGIPFLLLFLGPSAWGRYLGWRKRPKRTCCQRKKFDHRVFFDLIEWGWHTALVLPVEGRLLPFLAINGSAYEPVPKEILCSGWLAGRIIYPRVWLAVTCYRERDYLVGNHIPQSQSRGTANLMNSFWVSRK